MSTLLSILGLLKTNSKVVVVVALCALSAWVTYMATKAHYEAKEAAFMQKIYAKHASQKDDYERRLSEATSKLVLESRRADANRAERDNLLNRLRVASARADGASADSDRSYRAEYAQCRRFLSEGAELLSEGSGLAGRIAREKDALAEVVNGPF